MDVTENPNAYKLLVIDDEPEICSLISESLSNEFAVTTAGDGPSGIQRASECPPDLVLVDLRMPGMDGLEVCKAIRSQKNESGSTPLVMVMTGRNDAEVDSFECGADDFVAKPFGLEQLRARIHARIRTRPKPNPEISEIIHHANLEADLERQEARLNGAPVELSSLEFRLLIYFMKTNGKVVSRADVLESNWPGVVVSDRTVDTHVSKLRKAIAGSEYQIQTIYGAGYCWRPSGS
jgi:DNA-binding response OmpR family regulator